jgi:hypothetical protein
MSSASAQEIKSDATNALKFTEGFLLGALDAEGFDDIEKCIKDVKTVVTDAETAVQDFEKKDVKDIISGFKAVADLVKNVKAGLTDCGHLEQDLGKLEAIFMTYTTLPSFAWHVGKDLVVNGV